MGGSHQFSDETEIEEYKRTIKEMLGEHAFQAAWEEGGRMTFQEMMALAKEEMP